jgi:hypothetical protein
VCQRGGLGLADVFNCVYYPRPAIIPPNMRVSNWWRPGKIRSANMATRRNEEDEEIEEEKVYEPKSSQHVRSIDTLLKTKPSLYLSYAVTGIVTSVTSATPTASSSSSASLRSSVRWPSSKRKQGYDNDLHAGAG